MNNRNLLFPNNKTTYYYVIFFEKCVHSQFFSVSSAFVKSLFEALAQYREDTRSKKPCTQWDRPLSLWILKHVFFSFSTSAFPTPDGLKLFTSFKSENDPFSSCLHQHEDKNCIELLTYFLSTKKEEEKNS